MTLLEVGELFLPYLRDHPPVHLLVAGIAGWKPRAVGAPGAPAGGFAALRAALGEGDVHAGMSGAAILDFNRLRASRT